MLEKLGNNSVSNAPSQPWGNFTFPKSMWILIEQFAAQHPDIDLVGYYTIRHMNDDRKHESHECQSAA